VKAISAYWISTILLAVAVGSGGLAALLQQPGTMELMLGLGYPEYFITIIGLWKVLGSVTLIVPGLLRLKEWAYAGIFFNMTGAMVSHVVMDSAGWHVGVTAAFAALTLASWALRPAGRTLSPLVVRRELPAPAPRHNGEGRSFRRRERASGRQL
jgi:hypothetical protein